MLPSSISRFREQIAPVAASARNIERGGTDVIDTKRRGIRCRAKKLIRDHGVTIEPDSQGTIVYEIEDLERRLILVEWDGGPSLYVFPNEIEITGVRKPRRRETGDSH
jgi:hypothetical protein